jgi:hypothetical protein
MPDRLTGAVRRWFALVGAMATVASVGAFGYTERELWAWRSIGALSLVVVSLALTAQEAYHARVAAENRTHMPPGGGTPMQLPVAYQADALRQVIARVSQTQDTLDYQVLDSVLKNPPAHGPIRSTSRCRSACAMRAWTSLWRTGSWSGSTSSHGGSLGALGAEWLLSRRDSRSALETERETRESPWCATT